MKKLVYLSMAIAVGVAAASCQKVELTPSENTEGSTFALNASIEQTKTTINGLKVNWEEGDKLYLVTTDGTWGKPYSEDNTTSTIAEYTYSAGTFASTATIANGTYTFNALYDGSASQKSYHRGASTTYMLQSTQSQDCSNPTGHLKLNDALVGTFTASVPMANPASVSMSHIFAIMRVDVKNATGADVELKSFEMSAAGATLAGVFTVNFANSPIDITEKSSQSSSIKVNLTNGAVASGASLPVYFVMAPLANYSGDVTFTVTDADNKVYTKTVALSNITFSAGSLNTTPYKITEGVAPTCYTWDLSVKSTSEATETKIAWTNDVADMVCLKGESTTNANNYYPGTGQSSTRFYKNSTLSITPKDGKRLTYYVFEATTTNYASALANSTWTNASVVVDGNTVTVVAKDPSVAVSATIGATCGFTRVECHTNPAPTIPPVINASPDSFNVEAARNVYTINYSIDFPVYGKSISAKSNQDWVNTFDYDTAGEISFVVDENTGDARIATVTLSYEGAENVTITVAQESASSVTYTALFGNSYNSTSVKDYTSTWSATNNNFTVVLKNWNNNQNGWNYIKAGSKNSASVATITTNAAISEAITKVSITINAVTASYINSITLYCGDSANKCTTILGTFTIATGEQSVTITSPTKNKFYKISADCDKSKSNGTLTVSKVVYTKE